ncbi:MAG: histidinol-phosphate transaminase [Oligoflexus sp.]|nr:histidinol-phosphate transaminase [Oligoflexus sp.]
MNTQRFVQSLARPNIVAMEAYRSARSENPIGGVWMDANELPWSGNKLVDGALDNRYPMPQPFTILDALAQFYSVDSSNLLVTRGIDEGIDVLIRSFCEAGEDTILTVEPSYGLYKVAAALQNCRFETVPLDEENGFALDASQLIEKIGPNTKIVILCNPNNPSGNLFAQEAVDAVITAARDRCLVLIDEAYIEFAKEGTIIERLVNSPHVVVMRTFSKAWGLAGIRVGVTIAHPAIIALLKKVLAPYPLSSPSLRALENRMTEEGIRELWRSTAQVAILREQLSLELCKLSAVRRVLPSATNFLLVEVDQAEAIVNRLREIGISIRDRSSRKRDYLRISVGTYAENLTILANLREILR